MTGRYFFITSTPSQSDISAIIYKGEDYIYKESKGSSTYYYVDGYKMHITKTDHHYVVSDDENAYPHQDGTNGFYYEKV